MGVGADPDLLDDLRDMPFGTYGHLADRYGVHWFFQGPAGAGQWTSKRADLDPVVIVLTSAYGRPHSLRPSTMTSRTPPTAPWPEV